MNAEERIHSLLEQIYGSRITADVFPRLIKLLDSYRQSYSQPQSTALTQRDSVLITYPDQVREPGRPTLQTLAEFCEQHLQGVVTAVHVLPFFPWSSDDGFSVIDYRQVAPQYGRWEDLDRLGGAFRLMMDAVINHASTQSAWFEAFRRGEPPYRDYFISLRDEPDLSGVVRPRTSPLLTTFDTSAGQEKIWSTFSADQADLNYQNPQVLLAMIDLLLFYTARGADFIRIDAAPFLWKEIGTSCLNLPQTHWIIQLLRACLDTAAPGARLVTEANVSHRENVAYFGDGTNEAQLVYNFSLPPLVLHAFQSGSSMLLSQWASTLDLPSKSVTFFNFLASHDGIGLNPLRGLLPEKEIGAMADQTELRGGFVSYRAAPGGTTSPYELNINYFDSLANPNGSIDQNIEPFLTAHAILLSFLGMPGIYFHSLFGSRGWREAVTLTGVRRSINRQKVDREELETDLADPSSLRSRLLLRLTRLLQVRSDHPAFDPYGQQRVLEFGRGIFALLRQASGPDEEVLCLHNVTAQMQPIGHFLASLPAGLSAWRCELITGKQFAPEESISSWLQPFQTLWLAHDFVPEKTR